MNNVELYLFWATIFFYSAPIGFFFYGLAVKTEKPFEIGVNIVLCGLIIQTIALVLRWFLSGHMPGNNIYELNAVGAWCAVLIYLWLQHYYHQTRVLGIVVLVISISMMLYGISKPHGIGPLSDEYQSPWFYIHIISAFLAYSCYVIATSAAILFLFGQLENERWARMRLPSSNFLEDINARFVAYGFGGHAVMLASGSIWANSAWGSYWNWDPVETWSLITWLIYAFHLHARTFLGWSGRRLAWISIVALIAIVFTFWGVSHLPSKDYEHL